jgi:hypothetical protein
MFTLLHGVFLQCQDDPQYVTLGCTCFLTSYEACTAPVGSFCRSCSKTWKRAESPTGDDSAIPAVRHLASCWPATSPSCCGSWLYVAVHGCGAANTLSGHCTQRALSYMTMWNLQQIATLDMTPVDSCCVVLQGYSASSWQPASSWFTTDRLAKAVFDDMAAFTGTPTYYWCGHIQRCCCCDVQPGLKLWWIAWHNDCSCVLWLFCCAVWLFCSASAVAAVYQCMM